MAISVLPHSAPTGVVAEACALVGGLGETLWVARGSDELVGTIESLQTCAPSWPRSRPRCWPRSTPARSRERELGLGLDRRLVHPPGRTPPRRGQTPRRPRPPADRRPAHDPGRAARGHRQPRTGRRGPRRRRRRSPLGHRGPRPSRARAARRGHPARTPPSSPRPPATCRGRRPRAARAPARGTALDREERAAHLHRFLSITDDGAGGVRLKGRGTIEDAATLRAALLPLTAPVPALDRPPRSAADPRDHGARLWDALVQVAQHALTTDLPPDPTAPAPGSS